MGRVDQPDQEIQSGAELHLCEAKCLGMELSVFCQQSAASSTEQTERAAGSVFTAEYCRIGSEVCEGH